MASKNKGPAAKRYVQVEVGMWNERDFRNLSKPPPNAQSLLFYLLTTPKTTRLPGLVLIGRLGIADDLDWAPEDVDRCFGELERAQMAVADWKAKVVYVRRPLQQEYNRPSSPSVTAMWRTVIRDAPE